MPSRPSAGACQTQPHRHLCRAVEPLPFPVPPALLKPREQTKTQTPRRRSLQTTRSHAARLSQRRGRRPRRWGAGSHTGSHNTGSHPCSQGVDRNSAIRQQCSLASNWMGCTVFCVCSQAVLRNSPAWRRLAAARGSVWHRGVAARCCGRTCRAVTCSRSCTLHVTVSCPELK